MGRLDRFWARLERDGILSQLVQETREFIDTTTSRIQQFVRIQSSQQSQTQLLIKSSPFVSRVDSELVNVLKVRWRSTLHGIRNEFIKGLHHSLHWLQIAKIYIHPLLKTIVYALINANAPQYLWIRINSHCPQQERFEDDAPFCELQNMNFGEKVVENENEVHAKRENKKKNDKKRVHNTEEEIDRPNSYQRFGENIELELTLLDEELKSECTLESGSLLNPVENKMIDFQSQIWNLSVLQIFISKQKLQAQNDSSSSNAAAALSVVPSRRNAQGSDIIGSSISSIKSMMHCQWLVLSSKSGQDSSDKVVPVEKQNGSRIQVYSTGMECSDPDCIESCVRLFLELLNQHVGNDRELIASFRQQLPSVSSWYESVFLLNQAQIYASEQKYSQYGIVAVDLQFDVNSKCLKEKYPQMLETFESLSQFQLSVSSATDENKVIMKHDANEKAVRYRFFIRGSNLVWCENGTDWNEMKPRFIQAQGTEELGPDEINDFDVKSSSGSVVVKVDTILRAAWALTIRMPTLYLQYSLSQEYLSYLLNVKVVKIERARADRLLALIFPLDSIISYIEKYYRGLIAVRKMRVHAADQEYRWMFWNEVDARIPPLPEWMYEVAPEVMDPKVFIEDIRSTQESVQYAYSDLKSMRTV